MTKEKIDELHSLESRMYDIKTKLRWMEDWSKVLYENKNDSSNDRFHLGITNGQGKFVLQREITREDAESEYNSRLLELEAEKAEIQSAIDAL